MRVGLQVAAVGVAGVAAVAAPTGDVALLCAVGCGVMAWRAGRREKWARSAPVAPVAPVAVSRPAHVPPVIVERRERWGKVTGRVEVPADVSRELGSDRKAIGR